MIPALSVAILTVGSLYVDKCIGEPLMPKWLIVCGAAGLVTPVRYWRLHFFSNELHPFIYHPVQLLYLSFDLLAPSLRKRGLSNFAEILDKAVVFAIAPAYVLFEVVWLICGTVWFTRNISIIQGSKSCFKPREIFVFKCSSHF